MKQNKPVLLIMAAGLGSRYGGLKQIEPIGPHGEILLEFALKDAIMLGIEKVVIIVSEAIKGDFESMIVPKYMGKLNILLVEQSLDLIPKLGTLSFDLGTLAKRLKPWGTAHAVWCAREVINGPCIVINADDFYGRNAIKQAYDFLVSSNELNRGNELNNHCIVTYPITSTLSSYGTVSRGICHVENGQLVEIKEHTKVGWKDGEGSIGGPNGSTEALKHGSTSRRLIHTALDGHEIPVPEDAPANMNLFGFQHSFFDVLDHECEKFFQEHFEDPKFEFFLPSVVQKMIQDGSGTVTALSTTSQWFGMTNPEDRIETKKNIEALIAQGEYN